jgi:hypothetical protein
MANPQRAPQPQCANATLEPHAFLDAERLDLVDRHAVARSEETQVMRERQLRAGADGSDKCYCEECAASGDCYLIAHSVI